MLLGDAAVLVEIEREGGGNGGGGVKCVRQTERDVLVEEAVGD
jgi:hypothetical protein